MAEGDPREAAPLPAPDVPGGSAEGAGARLLRALARRALSYGPALVATAFVGTLCVQAILDAAGHPALPLDDAFIHMQYARRLAEGHFYSYVAGEGYSSGATSLAWPLLLAPFYKLGFRDLSLVYVVWALGFAVHAAVTVETARLARPLAGRAAAAGAGAMCAAFGAFAWFAWSGMETLALSWALLRTARHAAERWEPQGGSRPGSAAALATLGFVAPLLRPEGALASLFAAVALAARPRSTGAVRVTDPVAASHSASGSAPPLARARGLFGGRVLALVPLAGVLVTPAMNLAFAGHAASSTTAVKWLVGNPGYGPALLWATIRANVRLLLTDLLDGGTWTAVFLPSGSSLPILLGAIALGVAAYRRQRPAHAAFVAAIALGTLLPCTYLSFLWNRVRYIWPFAPAWFVLVACLARELGDAARCVRRSMTYITPLLVGACAGALAMRLPWAIRDLAQSAAAIDRQQVTLGRWAAQSLPESAVIGVNDTGAIAYISGHKTFDVVGLTTEGEARYWVAGAGSRFEHYETLPAAERPTHFIVYPHWMACSPVLGEALTEATVVEQSILGGTTMVAYEARWDALGTGAAPMHAMPGERVLDDIDVSDLESEAAHAYDLAGGTDQDNQVVEQDAPVSTAPGALDAGRTRVADGGRLRRRVDRFTARLEGAPAEARLVLRVASDQGATLSVSAGGEALGNIEVPAGAWVERAVALPASRATTSTDVRVAAQGGGVFHAFHYWVVGR